MSVGKRPLSRELILFARTTKRDGLALKDFLTNLGDRSHALLVLVPSLPFLFPITIPGTSTPFGLIIIFISGCMMLGVPPWMPERVGRKEIQGEFAFKALRFAAAILRRLEKLVRPRGRWFSRNPFMHRVNGAAMLFAGMLLALPTPPGGNVPPAIPLVLLSLGSLEDDGYFVVAGYVALALCTLLFGAVAYFGVEIVTSLF